MLTNNGSERNEAASTVTAGCVSNASGEASVHKCKMSCPWGWRIKVISGWGKNQRQGGGEVHPAAMTHTRSYPILFKPP